MALVVVLIAMMTSLICLLTSLSDTCRGDGGPCGDGPSDGVNYQKKSSCGGRPRDCYD